MQDFELDDDELLDVQSLEEILHKYKSYLKEDGSALYFCLGYLTAKGYTFKSAIRTAGYAIND